MCRYDAENKQDEAIRLSKIRNTSSALERRDSRVAGTTKALVNYAAVFELDCGVRFVDVRIKDTVDDTRPS